MPDDRGIQDSSGLARALTGDFKGAIADFEGYIAQADGDKTSCKSAFCTLVGKGTHVKGERENTKHEPLSPSPFPDKCQEVYSKAQRQRWVKELRAGKNPLTDTELKKLRRE
ncbi:Tetratricopeptide [Nostoc flagelliforme CCNUN1]|uniref:Tetratricopeptide n=2 Tax=Nostoc flagelliforme TaxID=1306274 RepID=A0A2K8SJ58_9NOSO|nr:hypothetical protein [Nostoc flagelliforme]ADO19191.1 WD-40 repeat protein [Nostoc flagelliforme str. Sunitezuoqi]AUB35471.1 Tetratricopeptide [Nostoc flagelliforme CCNUN1]